MVTQRFAVIGNPIEHSLSPLIHQWFARQCRIELSYERILLEKGFFARQVQDFFATGGTGLNVTTPGKEEAYALCSIATSRAAVAKAVNTLWINEGKLMGDNTDGAGFLRDLKRHAVIRHPRILLLGAGGAARGIIAPLLSLQPEILMVANRDLEKALRLKQTFPEIAASDWQTMEGRYNLVINATSASLAAEALHLPENLLSQKPFCYDLNYDIQKPTPFVTYANKHGCRAEDGIGMLVEQAAEAFYIWHHKKPDTAAVLAYFTRKKKKPRV
ncbi:shikimate 5-dehydrogenase [Legionella londiniensis]|uniref:Shikimate dehydrogenase (NADP(+)) n=1 Tax=Legionella londiniensis TaxID=45068 RepID=A0A0W0VI19_9GAMM|nr:shikimate 5-dehydrogenase [Legionella londiniensis]STX92338.1 shikimate 5-dehydrogenase [Legionella londiniensis]